MSHSHSINIFIINQVNNVNLIEFFDSTIILLYQDRLVGNPSQSSYIRINRLNDWNNLMRSHLCRSLSIKGTLLMFGVSFLFGASTVIANTQAGQNMGNEKAFSLNEKGSASPVLSQDLIPMPLGQLDEAAKKVQSSRDPFQNTPAIESNNLAALKSALRLKGLVKSGDSLLAMIKTGKGQEFYKVGDSLGNGFYIKDISQKEVTVDISNGYKHYRLSLFGLNK